MMRAVTHRRYGAPGVLRHEDIARPVPGPGDVLVKVHAANASFGDTLIIAGKPYLIRLSPFSGVRRPRNLVPGKGFAGRVEAIGSGVTTVKPGDDVFGEAVAGAFAEYAAVPEKLIAPRPANLSFEDAAAVPWGVAALQGLRVGGIEAGRSVLVIGASGGVGTWAVQIAKALGARVTGVCSARNVAMVRGLGADDVIDYESRDFAAGPARYDLILDMVGNRSLAACRRALAPDGAYVAGSGGTSGAAWLMKLATRGVASLFTRQHLLTLFTKPNRDDLLILKALVEAGKVKPVIRRRYAFNDVAEALRQVGARHAQGQTIVQVASVP